MKYTIRIRYEIDAPLAICVATYLDCEHYTFLHERLTKQIDILEHGVGYYRCRVFARTFGLNVGQSYTAQYIPPATFIQYDIKPYPRWWPSIHHFLEAKTTLRYYETPDRKTTLSDLSVELDLPFWLYPCRKLLHRAIEKIKIVKDLEDVAMIDRRAKLYGRNNNSAYLSKHQFMLHKEAYCKYFGKDSEFYGETPEEFVDVEWTDVKELGFPYVREFMEKDYAKYV